VGIGAAPVDECEAVAAGLVAELVVAAADVDLVRVGMAALETVAAALDWLGWLDEVTAAELTDAWVVAVG